MSKKILVTGSTDGIGKLAAMKLAKQGHHLFLHGRNSVKLNAVIEEIKSSTGNQNIGGFIADFSDLSEVRRMSQEIKNQLTDLDVLINNAGVFKTKTPINKNGLDTRLVVNYYAPYLLTKEIFHLLKQKPQATVINLSSAAQETVTTEFLNGSETFSDTSAYSQSKLAILMWSFFIAQEETTVSTIALNPGSLLNTNMVREAYGKFWSSADKGADIIFDLATVATHIDNSGNYYDNDKGDYGLAHPDAYKTELQEQLINQTDKYLPKG